MNGVDWLDGTELVVGIENGYGVGELWRLGIPGGVMERIPDGGNARSPTIADGRIVYSRDDIASGIWAVPESGPAPATPVARIQSTRVDVNPQVSPDGSAVAFVSERSGTPQVWLATGEAEEETVLTDLDCHWLGPPRWSPDGGRLLFESRSAQGFEVHSLNLADNGVETLEPPFDTYREPAWGPEGEILLSAPVDGVWQLWSRNLEGSGDGAWRQVTTDGGFVSAVGPNGAWLYYTKFEQPGLWRMPIGGGDEQQVIDWLEHHDRRNWALTSHSLIAARGPLDRRSLVRQDAPLESEAAPAPSRELVVVEETFVLGVSASEEDVYFGTLEFEGSDIYSIDAG